MVTNSGGITTPALHSAARSREEIAHGVDQSWLVSPGRPRLDSPRRELASLKRELPAPQGRGEQLVELVVAAVTVVADVLTLALSRSSTQAPHASRKPGYGAEAAYTPLIRKGPRGAETGATGMEVPAVPAKRLEAIRDDAGDISVLTHDGYVVRADAKGQGWSISSPDGKTTRVINGSQVRESDGGSWAVKGRSSFLFGPHKLTVQMTPSPGGVSVPCQMTIYSGGERVTIGGVNTPSPFLEAIATDASYHDAALHDGSTYLRGQTKRGESWRADVDGASRVMGAR